MNDFIPIEPRLNENGELSSIKKLFPDANAHPHPLDGKDPLFNDFRIVTRLMSLQTAASIGFGSYFTSNMEMNSFLYINDIALYTPKTKSVPGNIISTTRWGCGLRLFTRFSQIKASAKMNIPISLASIAAGVELGLVKASYQIEGIGLGLDQFITVLENINPFGLLTLDNLFLIQKTVFNEKILRDLTGPQSALQPVPFEVSLNKELTDCEISVPQSFIFGIRRLIEGLTLAQAKEKGRSKNFNPDLIELAYNEIVHQCASDHKPTTHESMAAQNWLEQI